MRELAAVISRDIYLHDPNVKWSDIVGLEHAKSLVKEAVVYPIKVRKSLHTIILRKWSLKNTSDRLLWIVKYC